MLIELLTGVLGAGGVGVVFTIGYAVGRNTTEQEELQDASSKEDARAEGYAAGVRETEKRCDDLYADDYDNGYNAGLEAGHAGASMDPVLMATTATAVRAARLPWIRHQVRNHLATYREAFNRVLEVACDVGERYRHVERLGMGGVVPIGDALNVCIYVADIVKSYDDNRILTRPHAGVFEGKAS